MQRFRLNVVAGALLILFAGLLGRLAKLQLVDAAAYSAKSSSRHDAHHSFRGLRGRILDRHGRTLVTSRRVLSVSVDPSLVKDPRDFARRLAALLDAEEQHVRIRRAIEAAPPGCRHRSICRSVEDERVVAQLARFAGNFPATLSARLGGLKVEVEERRSYPNAHYAAHVLGRAPREERDGPQGGEGVEGTFHDTLKGGTMDVEVQRDGGRGRLFRSLLVVDPERAAGPDLYLTLDIVVQHSLEAALDQLLYDWSPQSAAGVVLDPRTGEVLALASRPNFQPTHEASSYNYAVQGRYPPGSIFKPFTAAYALGLGVVGIDERVPLPQRRGFTLGRHTRTISDGHPTADVDGCGDVPWILAHSSNPGAADLLWRVMALGAPPGEHRVHLVRKLTVRLGLNHPTGIELRGERPTRYDNSQGRWNPLYPTIGFAFGQGLAMSPLRLASCFAAFGRDDARIVRPTLIPGQGGARRDLPPVCARPEHLRAIRAGLRLCVEEGTGRNAFAGCAIPVAGKTGTAQLSGTPWQVAGFAGFAPADRPQVLVLVVAKVNENHRHPTTDVRPFGGNVAGPAVRRVVEHTIPYLAAQANGSTGERQR